MTAPSPGGLIGVINCTYTGLNKTGACAATGLDTSAFVVTATANAGSALVGWTGCDMTSGPIDPVSGAMRTCSALTSSAKTITANFSRTFTLTAAGSGAGTGTMTDPGNGINCAWNGSATSGACARTGVSDTTYAIVAAPDSGSIFVGWTGCATITTTTLSNDTCHVMSSSDATVRASFTTTSGTTLAASMACNGSSLDVTITGGSAPFDITGSGPGLPANGAPLGTTQLPSTGLSTWSAVTVTETTGSQDQVVLGSKTCGVSSQAAPAPRSPKNGLVIRTRSAKLGWKVVKGAAGYQVQLADNTGFSNPRTVGGIAKSPVTISGLAFGVYFWRVAVHTPAGWSPYSAPFSFEVTLLKAPKKNAVVRTHTPKFSWQKLGGATGYILEVSKDPGFADNPATLLIHTTAQSKTTFTTPKTGPLPSGKLYWRVSPDGGHIWTAGWAFTIQP